MFHFKHIHIKNFKSIKEQEIDFWVNKTVFVGKNSAWKSNILKAIEKVFAFENTSFKESDFMDTTSPIIIRAKLQDGHSEYTLELQAIYNSKTKKIKIFLPELPKVIKEKIKTIYIRSDRKIDKNNTNNGFNRLISLILLNKEFFYQNKKKADFKSLKSLRQTSSEGKTNLFITLLKLYLYSIENTSNDGFRIFIIDQPENFLHPHATKLIDRLLLEIWANRNTQIFYSTHSPELVSNFKKEVYELRDIVFVKNDNGYTSTKKIQGRYGKYNKIMINLIFKNASLFFSDSIILTEWETERISIPNIYENHNWKRSDLPKSIRHLDPKNFFDLDTNNINVIEVWWKWSLPEWYRFCCEIFWKEKVFAIIDQDKNFETDRHIISNTIKQVHKKRAHSISGFKKYNWIVLNGEFEHYYKVEAIQKFLTDTINYRAEKRFWSELNPVLHQESFYKLEARLIKLQETKKISKWYELLFNRYFKRYGKPTIAFHISTWLSRNNGYHRELIYILRDIIIKLQK